VSKKSFLLLSCLTGCSYLTVIKDVTAAVDLPCIIHPVGRYSIPFGQGLPLKTTKAILDECPNVIGWLAALPPYTELQLMMVRAGK
jgi:hypothetical protein